MIAGSTDRVGVPDHLEYPADADERTDQGRSHFHRRCAVCQGRTTVRGSGQQQGPLDQIGVPQRQPEPGPGDRGIGVIGEDVLIEQTQPPLQDACAAIEAETHGIAFHQCRGVCRVVGRERLQEGTVDVAGALEMLCRPGRQGPEPLRIAIAQPRQEQVGEQPVVAVLGTLLIE